MTNDDTKDGEYEDALTRIRAADAAVLTSANAYQIDDDDNWVLEVLGRVSQFPGHYMGSKKTSALAAFLRGYRVARLDAGLPCGGALLQSFCRWVMQSPGDPGLMHAMSTVDSTDNVARFFELFDKYIRDHGRPDGLPTGPSQDSRLDRADP